MISKDEADGIARAWWVELGMGPREDELTSVEVDGGWRYRGATAGGDGEDTAETSGGTDLVVRARDGRLYRVPVGATPAVVASILARDP